MNDYAAGNVTPITTKFDEYITPEQKEREPVP